MYLYIVPFLPIHPNIFILSKTFNITLKVEGKGEHKILYPGDRSQYCPLDNFRLPDEIIINGIAQNTINYIYDFNETENIVIIRYHSQEDVNNVAINKCFFYRCSEITEIDLSEFDTSQFVNMFAMFSECFHLRTINLKNFNTSNVIYMHLMFFQCNLLKSVDVSMFDTRKVVNMNRMFYKCYSLSSLDLSNFITSNVQIFYQMFYQCKSLTSLDLSNFNTVKLSNMTDMFKECNKLEYLNLKNFKNGLVVLENDFYNTPENIVICTDSDSILSHINSHKKCRTVTCDENWKEHQQKINTENDECTNDCLNVNYKYLYGSKCINNCPERTIENNYICEDCHEDCKICSDKYSDNNSNCITCLDENKFINFGNCVSNCKNDYYNYFNETLDLTIKTCKCDLENCFQCTQESLNNNNSCISCNIQKGYYPIENDLLNKFIFPL